MGIEKSFQLAQSKSDNLRRQKRAKVTNQLPEIEEAAAQGSVLLSFRHRFTACFFLGTPFLHCPRKEKTKPLERTSL